MKITDLNQGANPLQYVNQPNSLDKQQGAQETKKQESPVDKVELSSQSREMQKINDVLEMTPDVRAERVAELKKLVQEGRYQVDNEAVADRMVNESIIDLIK